MFNPIKKIKEYYKQKDIKWAAELNELGFHNITFPILLKEGNDIDVVSTLKDFSSDVDLFFHEFDNRNDFIDSKGNLWSWKYDYKNKINLPGTIKSTLTIEEVKEIITNYYKGSKIKHDIYNLISNASSITDLINSIANKL